jgi:diguanylate cyclase (GGDEF)-like protein
MLVGASIDWPQYALSIGLLAAALALPLLRPPGGHHDRLTVISSSLLFLGAVAILRNSAGGMTSGAGVVSLIPVFYTALNSRSGRDLGLILFGVAVFYLAPILIIGPPTYPASQYRAALLSVAVSSIIGLTTQRLVADVRHQAGEARSREQMLEQVTKVVHGLFDSPQARIDVCEAVRAISGATVALLYEPMPNSDRLLCTAKTGSGGSSAEISAARFSVVHEVFESGRPMLVNKDLEARVGSVEMWTAYGRPGSILYQPLIRGDKNVGVLVVGWPGQIPAEGQRARIAALLAHEAAAVIARADVMDHLNDEAQTDALTGLPNRRAWDVHLQRALGDGRQFAIAMLDFDHFKDFNDTYGHPAGDRLLKGTAAVWRDELRTGDFLARLGGEEFALMLFDCDTATAREVVERLRGTVMQGRTCSAGLAVRAPRESAEAVIARADRALYQAKAEGRDRTRLSIS